MKRIIVAGGGAAGFMSAFYAKRPDTEVTVLEAQEKPGKKLLATGNGKCNLRTGAFLSGNRAGFYRSCLANV